MITSKQTRVTHPLYRLLPTRIAGLKSLAELALDVRWSWNHAADEIWWQLDPELWELTHNPWVILQTVARNRIERLAADPDFRDRVAALVRERRRTIAAPAWFQQTYPESELTAVAYFSMEFMLSEALPIYSGGLGNVAGDQLKAASDLGVPVIGIGLLYSRGYFRQLIDKAGVQQAVYPYNDPGQMPVTPLRRPDGEWLRFQLDLPDYPIWLRAWQVEVGRTRLYLLDSNDAANYPPYRAITSELYGGDQTLRLLQELVLGVGGWRLLAALGIEPEVCHLNEGHAALAVLERARSFMRTSGQPFNVSLAATRAGNLFTTHTAVAAGFDLFPPELIERVLGAYARQELGIAVRDLLALGRRDANDAAEEFNMAYLAIRGSGAVNGVSRLHGGVSRHLFAPLFPRWPLDQVPIGHVTNGVHMPSWDSAAADDLWTGICGKHRWREPTEVLEQRMRRAGDAELWRCRIRARRALIEYVRAHLARQLAGAGAPAQAVAEARRLLDPDVLTLGFARRFATYKRPNLLLHNRERLLRILTNRERPVQLLIAGKAHPADRAGQAMIQEWIEFIRGSAARQCVVFLSDYDMLLTEQLVQGVDVWINTPRRPWEASGTSGMKALVNGGINLSELDGWWAEAYTPEVGWALGDGREHGDDPTWDAGEAEALYDLLEREVTAEFYTRDAEDIPRAWVARMRESMARLTPQFSTNRSVREYTEGHYLPAAARYRGRAADNGAHAVQLMRWRRALEEEWPTLRFGEVKVTTDREQHSFEVQVDLANLDPGDVRVELYADGVGDHAPVRQEMERVRRSAGTPGSHVYRARVPAGRPAADYTPRVVPQCADVAVPLEAAFILWQC